MDAPVEQVPDLINDDIEDYWSDDWDIWCRCPKCNPAIWEELGENARNEEFVEQIIDFHKSGRTTTRANFVKEKMARRNAYSASANRDHMKINGSKKLKTNNRQAKRRKIVTTEIAHDNMGSTYDSWSFFVNPQAPQSFANYDDPEEVDSVCYDSDYQWWLTFGSGPEFEEIRWDGDEDYYRELSEFVEEPVEILEKSMVVIQESVDDFLSFDTPSESYRDLRSKRKDEIRLQKQKKKYYDYRGSRPEWVGSLYYDLTLTVPEKTNTNEQSTKSKRKKRIIERSTPNEVEDVNLLAEFQRAYWGWLAWELPGHLHAAGKFVDTENRITRAPKPQVGTLIASPVLDQILENYKAFAGKYPEFYSRQHALLQANPTARLRLKVQRWTKNDNFDNRTEFKEHWYIRRRHRSRKLTREEKTYRNYKLREMGRNMKSRSQRLDATGSPANISRGSGSGQILHENALDRRYCWCEDYISLSEYIASEPEVEVEDGEDLPISDCVQEGSSSSEMVLSESSAVDVHPDEIQAAILKLTEDGWVLFEEGTSENSSVTDIDRLSDLEEILNDSDWDTLD